MWTANSHGTGAIWPGNRKHSFHFSYIKRKSSNANSYQISKNNYSDEQGSVNPTRVKLKQYFICFFNGINMKLQPNLPLQLSSQGVDTFLGDDADYKLQLEASLQL